MFKTCYWQAAQSSSQATSCISQLLSHHFHYSWRTSWILFAFSSSLSSQPLIYLCSYHIIRVFSITNIAYCLAFSLLFILSELTPNETLIFIPYVLHDEFTKTTDLGLNSQTYSSLTNLSIVAENTTCLIKYFSFLKTNLLLITIATNYF